MYQLDAENTANNNGVVILVASVLLLTGVGLVTLYSSSWWAKGDLVILKQAKISLLGISLFFACSLVSLEKIRKLTTPLLFASVVLCILTLIPGIGKTELGAPRWIKIGSNSYQPSEMVKFSLPFYLAHTFDRKREKINGFVSGILAPLLVTCLLFALICAQRNFSTAVFVLLNAAVIFFLAGIRYRYIIAAFAMFLPVSSLLVFSNKYRVERFYSYLRPESDPLDTGYQAKISLTTIISGGFLGKGLGQGMNEVASVPEVHSDFIFSAFAAEAGFIGVFLFFVLLAVFAFFGYRAAMRSNSVFRSLLAFGLVTMIISQALLNTAVVSGVLPVTGVPLPFFSAGGSSLITTLISAGLVVNVARNGDGPGPKKEFAAPNMEFNPLEDQDVR